MPIVIETPTFTAVALDKGEPSIGEVDWASENLVRLPTVIGFSNSELEVLEWLGEDNDWYRSVGSITVSPEEKKRFRIHLYRGATTADLDWLEGVIESAKHGHFSKNGWLPSKNLPGTYFFNYSRYIDGPGLTTGSTEVLVPCDESKCEQHTEFENWHLSDDDGNGWFEHTQPKISTVEEHTVQLVRDRDRIRWGVNVEADRTYSDLQLASLINDLQWAMADLKKHNAHIH